MRALLPILLMFAVPLGAGEARDFLPQDHGLRYVGHEGSAAVTVEITLRERLDGELEYVRWVTPRGWTSWFRKASRSGALLAFRDDRLQPLGYDPGTGEYRPPPAELEPGALDELGVRLRARADIARGLREARYRVWRDDDRLETWTLTVTGTDTVETPDGRYTCLKFRLGSESEWLEGWSAPLLVFHFVKLEHWRDGKRLSALLLDDKQL